jgi:hypothetical protein
VLQSAEGFDREKCLYEVTHSANSYTLVKNLPLEALKDREIVMAGIVRFEEFYNRVPSPLRNDLDVVLKAIQNCSNFTILDLPDEMKGNRQVMSKVVKKNHAYIFLASDDLKDDYDFILHATKCCHSNLFSASTRLRSNRDLVLAAVQCNGRALYGASDELKADREIVMAAMKSGGYLVYASKDLKAEHSVVMAAVRSHGFNFQYASQELQNNREIIVEAAVSDGQVLNKIPSNLKEDRSIITAILKRNGRALQFVSKELRGNREIVLTAVNHCGCALEDASRSLRSTAFVKAVAKHDVDFACKLLEKLGSQRPNTETKRDKIAADIVEVVKYFPELEQEAQEASARIENPLGANGKYSRAHKRSRKEFEAEFESK